MTALAPGLTPAEAAGVASGICRLVEAHTLGDWTTSGWKLLREILVHDTVTHREDVLAPAGLSIPLPNNVYPGRQMAIESSYDLTGKYVSKQLLSSDDPRVISLVRTSSVLKPMFLLTLDEHSAIAQTNGARQAAEARLKDALASHEAAKKACDEAKKETAQIKQDLAASVTKREQVERELGVQRDRGQAMENELGRLREEFRKLAAALGDLKVRELLSDVAADRKVLNR